jgi:hypothetical protein
VLSKSTLFIATAVTAGLVGAVRGLPAAPRGEPARHTAAERPVVAPAAHHFQNCTDLRLTWPHGVGRASAHDHVADPKRDKPVTDFHHSRKIYAANATLDRDRDHIACEAH